MTTLFPATEPVPLVSDVPAVVQERIARFVVDAVQGIRRIPETAREEALIPGTRFTVDGCTVSVGAIKVIVTRGK